MPLRTFLVGRQVPVLVALLAATGVLVWFGGDLNMPLPGARVPIVLGSIAPLICACLCLNALDAGAGTAWTELTSPRRMGRPRTALLATMLVVAAVIVLVTGAHSLGIAVAASLVRGTGLLVGPAAVAWSLGGQGAGVAVASTLTVVFSSFGSRGAAAGETWASWAVLFAEPGSILAWSLGAAGFGLALAAAGTRDGLRDRRLTHRRTRRRAVAVPVPTRGAQHLHGDDTAT